MLLISALLSHDEKIEPESGPLTMNLLHSSTQHRYHTHHNMYRHPTIEHHPAPKANAPLVTLPFLLSLRCFRCQIRPLTRGGYQLDFEHCLGGPRKDFLYVGMAAENGAPWPNLSIYEFLCTKIVAGRWRRIFHGVTRICAVLLSVGGIPLCPPPFLLAIRLLKKERQRRLNSCR